MELLKSLKLNLIGFFVISSICAFGAEIYFQVSLSSSFWVYAAEKGELIPMLKMLFYPWVGFPFLFLAFYLKFRKDNGKKYI